MTTNLSGIADLCEQLGDDLYGLSADLLASGFLESEQHQQHYESVVASFNALSDAADAALRARQEKP